MKLFCGQDIRPYLVVLCYYMCNYHTIQLPIKKTIKIETLTDGFKHKNMGS